MRRKAFKYRLYPNKTQQAQLAIQFGHARYVYNYFRALREEHYAKTKKGLNCFDTILQLTQLKKQPETSWLKEAASQVLQQSLKDLDKAYRNFFRRVKNGEAKKGFPRFKSRRDKQSIRYPQGFKLNDKHIYLLKVGWVKVVQHRPIEGLMKNCTVSKTKSGKYFVSIQVEIADKNLPELALKMESDIGIDLGLKELVITSDGERFANPRHLRKAEKRLKRMQQRMSRTQKGSANRDTFRIKLARQYERVVNKRRDLLHKISHALTKKHTLICLESLNIKGMVKNHNLAKSIHDVSWFELVRQLTYKAEWYGCQIVQVGRFFPSSKTCHCCGFHNADLTLDVRNWQCPECQTMLDRDLNAAINIRNEGERLHQVQP